MYFDTHAHYDDSRFDGDREQLLASLPEKGISLVLNPGITVESSLAAIALAERFPHVYAAAGIHPGDCGDAGESEVERIGALLRREKVVALGEVGLDYHWEDNPPREQQQRIFRAQLALAREADLPVIIHDREAHGDTLAVLSEFPGLRGVFHCYSGSPEMAKELLKRGWYLGFDGPVTYKDPRNLLKVLAVTPVDRILLETDAPYLTPVPHRSKRNNSAFLPLIAAAAAAVKEMEPEALGRAAAENGRRLFGIPAPEERGGPWSA